MARIKIHILKEKLPFYPPYEVKYRLQNKVSTSEFEAMVIGNTSTSVTTSEK